MPQKKSNDAGKPAARLTFPPPAGYYAPNATDMRSKHATPPGHPGNKLHHIAFVIDGLAVVPDRAAAVTATFEKARTIVAFAFASFPELLAVSFFSPEIQAWLRDQRHGRAVIAACAQGLGGLAASADAENAAFRLLGRVQELPEEVRAQTAPTADRARRVTWFLNYSGRDEILRAATRFLEANPGLLLREADLPAWLDTAGIPDPDLLLYSGGEIAPKDFLLWQASYAELWHSPQPWTSFSTNDLQQALEDYFRRQRRFGK